MSALSNCFCAYLCRHSAERVCLQCSCTRALPTTARLQSSGRFFSPTQTSLRSKLRPWLLFQTLSVARERDAQSSGRCPNARPFRLRAVPRANRTLPTAHTPNHSATSSTTARRFFAPWLPWRCFFLGASPDARTGDASRHHNAPLPVLLLPADSAAARCLAC
jgi:hypothetical protein